MELHSAFLQSYSFKRCNANAEQWDVNGLMQTKLRYTLIPSPSIDWKRIVSCKVLLNYPLRIFKLWLRACAKNILLIFFSFSADRRHSNTREMHFGVIKIDHFICNLSQITIDVTKYRFLFTKCVSILLVS